MAELIIGHATADSATLWVRGGAGRKKARVRLRGADGHAVESETLRLNARDDWTGAVTLSGLHPETDYEVRARFPRLGRATVERAGTLRTYPEDGAALPYSFLLGSCNLSSARLTRLRELVAGYLGHSALDRSLKRDVRKWLWPRRGRRLLRKVVPLASGALVKFVQKATRYQLESPDYGDPFGRLLALLEKEPAKPAFTVHAGDQIYFDLDLPAREPVADEFRLAYQQAWFEDDGTRGFLASGPQYMILDNHDVAFRSGKPVSQGALQAYREYVHRRQPQSWPEKLYYEFGHGHTRFFFLDVRNERHPAGMLHDEQVKCLKEWLLTHADLVKFVVTSVPFVAQVGPLDEPEDKWCGSEFRAQRDEILEFVHDHQLGKLVFLSGDMHCTYHAVMRVGPPSTRVVLHELASGPFNQVEFGRRAKFHEDFRGRTARGLTLRSAVHALTGAAASVIRISVDAEGNVGWRQIRLAVPRSDDDKRAEKQKTDPLPLWGRIRFE